MLVSHAVTITAAVEGYLNEAVVRRIAQSAGGHIGIVHGREGKGAILRNLPGYNAGALHSPWTVLIDLDGDAICAPSHIGRVLATPARLMAFRVAVREVESWLLADREAIARWLGVGVGRVPTDPDTLQDPKGEIVGLARRSNRRDLRSALVPREGSGRRVGPLYTTEMMKLVLDTDSGWRPEIAITSSDSLARCFRALKRLVENAQVSGR